MVVLLMSFPLQEESWLSPWAGGRSVGN